MTGFSPPSCSGGYRKSLVGSHILYFRHTASGTIDIVRILHQRMDVMRHL